MFRGKPQNKIRRTRSRRSGTINDNFSWGTGYDIMGSSDPTCVGMGHTCGSHCTQMAYPSCQCNCYA